MIYVISDIHGNIDALKSFLKKQNQVKKIKYMHLEIM